MIPRKKHINISDQFWNSWSYEVDKKKTDKDYENWLDELLPQYYGDKDYCDRCKVIGTHRVIYCKVCGDNLKKVNTRGWTRREYVKFFHSYCLDYDHQRKST